MPRKVLAAESNLTVIKVKEEKRIPTRDGNFIALGGRFPRLTKPDAKARLKEIKRLLLVL